MDIPGAEGLVAKLEMIKSAVDEALTVLKGGAVEEPEVEPSIPSEEAPEEEAPPAPMAGKKAAIIIALKKRMGKK